MLKLKLFGHQMWRVHSLEKNPDAGKDWRQEEKGAAKDEMVSLTPLSLSKLWEIEEDSVWHAAVHGVAELGHDWATEQEQTKQKPEPNPIPTFQAKRVLSPFHIFGTRVLEAAMVSPAK